MVVLDFSIVNVALPSIQYEFGFPSATVQWVVTGYAITFGGLLILGGRAADLFGRRRMFITGLVVYGRVACWRPGTGSAAASDLASRAGYRCRARRPRRAVPDHYRLR
jgi:MFS family permease